MGGRWSTGGHNDPFFSSFRKGPFRLTGVKEGGEGLLTPLTPLGTPQVRHLHHHAGTLQVWPGLRCCQGSGQPVPAPGLHHCVFEERPSFHNPGTINSSGSYQELAEHEPASPKNMGDL